MTVFLVCPVRKVWKKELKMIQKYVEGLESQSHKVHWPYRDTDQNDPNGLKIISQNREAMKDKDEIHFWWKADKKGKSRSEGSVFDFGMVWMLKHFFPEKKIVLANPLAVKPSQDKSFTNVLLLLDSVDSVKK